MIGKWRQLKDDADLDRALFQHNFDNGGGETALFNTLLTMLEAHNSPLKMWEVLILSNWQIK